MGAIGWFALLAASLGLGAVAIGHERTRGRSSSPSSRDLAPPSPPSYPLPPPIQTAQKGHPTMPGTNTPTLESWRPYFVMLGPDMPIEAEMKWTAIESAGNPCGIGSTPAPGATQPQEYGLGQLNAKDPSNLAIATPQSLRDGLCGVGPGLWQVCLRPLTDADYVKHATALLGIMRHCADMANGYLGRPAGTMSTAWPTGWRAPDFWRLAKTYHASSAVANLFPGIQKSLGRQPSWSEFKAHANTIALANGFTQPYMDRVWHNAEQLGAAIPAATTAPLGTS